MATILRAKYDYRSGNVLLLPKTGFAPGLFLEFIRDYYLEQKREIRFQIRDSTNINESEFFIIKMFFELRGTFADAVSYINNNLPKD